MRQIISLSLPEILTNTLIKEAKIEHTNKSEIIRQALNDFFAKKKLERICTRATLECKRKGINLTEEEILNLE